MIYVGTLWSKWVREDKRERWRVRKREKIKMCIEINERRGRKGRRKGETEVSLQKIHLILPCSSWGKRMKTDERKRWRRRKQEKKMNKLKYTGKKGRKLRKRVIRMSLQRIP